MEDYLINILSASSILLAIITALWGIFSHSISEVLDHKVEPHPADNKIKFKLSKNTVKTKLLPLLIGSILITTAFTPELILQLVKTFRVLWNNGFNNVSYSTISASYIVICVFMYFITISIIITCIKIRNKLNKLNPNRKSRE